MIARIFTISALHLAALFFMAIAYSNVESTLSIADVSETGTQIVASLPNS